MSATLTILGCRAGAPANGAAASGYLIQSNHATILVDCGPGVALTLASLDPPPILDAVIVSHRHADHCGDLLALAYQRCFPEPHSALPLFGPPDLAAILDGLDRLFGIPSLPALTRPLRHSFAFYPVTPGDTFVAAGVLVETCAACHPVPTLAMRFPELGLAYTADTALTETLIEHMDRAAVLLAEATYPTDAGRDLERHGHMTAAQAGELAQRAAAGRLLLTHLAAPADADETYQAAARRYAGAITVVTPGLRAPLEV
ncbi:MAG: MBL fold metallo-hydrolase [Oscillochloridaceae bacterium]|nr:MBL fold metallo-hydrolase [Chloroflexaceae bacterium]MDW8389603.1 MBL fold metallo-hydrolase [Oscillochloridaceae bacterium]